MNITHLVEHRAQIAKYGNELLRTCYVDFVKLTDIELEFYGTFLFGVIFFYTSKHNLTRSDDRVLTTWMLMDVLEFSEEKANKFSDLLIHISSSGMTSTEMERTKHDDPGYLMKVIIHRGMLGQRQLAANDRPGLQENTLGVLDVVKKVRIK